MTAATLTPRDPAPVPIARGVRRLAHGQVHYRAAGEGPVVLALHASPRSSLSLLPVIEALADRCRVIAPDTPGYGLSAPLLGEAPTLDDFADALIGLLDALGVPCAAVYGTHTGAALALALASRAPERVSALVLDGLSAFTPQEVEAFRTDYLTPYAPTWDGAHVMGLWSRVKDLYTWFPWCERTPERRLATEPTDPDVLHASALAFLEAGPHYAKAYVRAAELDPVPRLQALQVPTLVMARPNDLIAHHLDRLPEPSGSWTIRRLGPSEEEWRSALMQTLSPSRWRMGEGGAHRQRRWEGEDGSADVDRNGAASRALPQASCTHAHPCPSPLEGEGFILLGLGWLHAVFDGPAEAPAHLILPDLPGDPYDLLARLRPAGPARRIVLSPPGCGASDPLADPATGLDGAVAALEAAWARLSRDRPPVRIVADGAAAVLANRLQARTGWTCAVEHLSPPAWFEGRAPPPDVPPLRPQPPTFDGAHLTAAWFQLRDLALYDTPPGCGAPVRRGDGGGVDVAALDRRFRSYVQGPECADLLAAILAHVRAGLSRA